ncbi:sel1 repeat family protein [Rhodobacteraceae bacterium]|nr:sel1 repeat family protein [Paracoccaceae bacterium]
MLNVIKCRVLSAGLRGRCDAAALITLIVLSTSGPILAADFGVGLKAFKAGNIEQALEEWQPLAQAGDPNAQHALGMMYEYGHGFERDDIKAATWYKKAAEQNMSEAQYRLGVFHDNGWGVARDARLAVKWYERAAQRGHAFAQHDLAYMHLNGTGVPKDKIQAYKWLKIASEKRADLMGKHLSNVSKTMTSGEILKAERLAIAWLNAQDI